MNKKTIYSVLTAALFLIAGQMQAQLSSSKPAMTDVQVKELIQQRSAAASRQNTNSVPVTASSQTAVSASSNPASRTVAVNASDNVSDSPARTTLPALPAVSNQGGVQPASSEPVKVTAPVKTETNKIIAPRVPAVPMQNTKTD